MSEVLAPLRPDPRIAVERAEADRARIRLARRVAEESGAALAAEDLREALLRLPGAQQLLAGGQPDGAALRADIGRRSRSGPPLAARAVAVARASEIALVDLVADPAAETSSGEHAPKVQPAGPRRTPPAEGGEILHYRRICGRQLYPGPRSPLGSGGRGTSLTKECWRRSPRRR